MVCKLIRSMDSREVWRCRARGRLRKPRAASRLRRWQFPEPVRCRLASVSRRNRLLPLVPGAPVFTKWVHWPLGVALGESINLEIVVFVLVVLCAAAFRRRRPWAHLRLRRSTSSCCLQRWRLLRAEALVQERRLPRSSARPGNLHAYGDGHLHARRGGAGRQPQCSTHARCTIARKDV